MNRKKVVYCSNKECKNIYCWRHHFKMIFRSTTDIRYFERESKYCSEPLNMPDGIWNDIENSYYN